MMVRTIRHNVYVEFGKENNCSHCFPSRAVLVMQVDGEIWPLTENPIHQATEYEGRTLTSIVLIVAEKADQGSIIRRLIQPELSGKLLNQRNGRH